MVTPRHVAGLVLVALLAEGCGSQVVDPGVAGSADRTGPGRPAADELAAAFDAWADGPREASDAQLACIGSGLVDSDLSDRDLRAVADDVETGFRLLSDDSVERISNGEQGPFAIDTLGAVLVRCLSGSS